MAERRRAPSYVAVQYHGLRARWDRDSGPAISTRHLGGYFRQPASLLTDENDIGKQFRHRLSRQIEDRTVFFLSHQRGEN